MVLTSDFRETVQARARRDPEFRKLLLEGGIEDLLAGEVEVARIILRDYIIATVGFDGLGDLTGKSPARIEQMLSPEGDLSAADLFDLIAPLAEHEGVHLDASAVR